jgi:hypothetical protein
MATKTATSKTTKTQTKTQTTTATDRKPADQALQVVDVAVGTPPTVAEAVRSTAETWTNSETRSREINRVQKRVQTLRASDGRKSELETLRKRLAAELEKAEAKGGDVRRQVTDQLVGQARKARSRVEPVYRERVEPTVKKVRERV